MNLNTRMTTVVTVDAIGILVQWARELRCEVLLLRKRGRNRVLPMDCQAQGVAPELRCKACKVKRKIAELEGLVDS